MGGILSGYHHSKVDSKRWVCKCTGDVTSGVFARGCICTWSKLLEATT